MAPVFPVPGQTPLIIGQDPQGLGIKNLWIKDEEKNPTHTFKDRLAFCVFNSLRQKVEAGEEIKPLTVAVISYGNAAFSLGFYAKAFNAMAGRELARVIAFAPENLEEIELGPDTEGRLLFGQKILAKLMEYCVLVKMDLGKKFLTPSQIEKIARSKDLVIGDFVWVSPYGLDRPVYHGILEETVKKMKKAPDYLVVPYGDGHLFGDLSEAARMKFQTKLIAVSVSQPDSLAYNLYNPFKPDRAMLARRGRVEVSEDGRKYTVYNITDEEIKEAVVKVREAVSAEPAGAAGFALLPRFREIAPDFDPRVHNVMVINTGNGFANFK